MPTSADWIESGDAIGNVRLSSLDAMFSRMWASALRWSTFLRLKSTDIRLRPGHTWIQLSGCQRLRVRIPCRN